MARQVVEELELPDPKIQASPDEDFVQMVRVPTWLWLSSGVWKPVTVTAEVPGVTVTATAEPQQVVWSMGDGRQVVCEGPGTPYAAGGQRPQAASPDCGHTYRRASRGQPEGVYTVQAAISWTVTWQGGGEAGVIPGLVTADEVPIQVDEMQAVVVADAR
ncbi:hypothetical protein [Streptomyces boninensis]|uniref:hypothetical protein n=1 Tax=Streptomyces boninensis TaxID=2039455 RepID=UPI003B227D82